MTSGRIARMGTAAALIAVTFGTWLLLNAYSADRIDGWVRQNTPEIITTLVAALSVSCAICLWQLSRIRRTRGHTRRIANDLLHLNHALVQEVETRRAAEAKAHRANEATARFLAIMSHEVRTPLNAIMGTLELIEVATDCPKIRRQAQTGHGAARRLFAELSNVLDVSRLDALALDVTPCHTDLAPLIADWRATLEGLVARAGRDLGTHFDIDDRLPDAAWLNPDRVTQIVTNLLDNAVKFTPQGQVTLAITALGRDLEIRVSDSGIGIPPDRRHRVFERFYQVDGGLDRRYQGAGLGLAICREIAQLMGADLVLDDSNGSLGAHQPPSSGSTFRLRMPKVLTEPSGDRGKAQFIDTETTFHALAPKSRQLPLAPVLSSGYGFSG